MVAQSTQKAGKTCFVAMPLTTPAFYTEKLNDSEHFPHVLAHLFVPALKEAGFTAIPPSARGTELIHAEIIRNLEQADLVLCDLSSLNPNVFFELGIRTSLDRPVTLVKDNFTPQIPFDLNAINTLTYDGSLAPWTLSVDVLRLTDHIENTIDSGNSGNSMWHYFGLTKRATPSEAGENPIEAKLDLLIREVQRSQLSDSVTDMRQHIWDSTVNQRRYLSESTSEALSDFGDMVRALGVTDFSLQLNEAATEVILVLGEEGARQISPTDRIRLNTHLEKAGFSLVIAQAPPHL